MKNVKIKNMQKNMKKNASTILGAILIVGLVVTLGKFFVEKENSVPPSRLWMEYTMDIVRETKPAPTESAYLYAAVATLYYENSDTCGEAACGNTAINMFLNKMYPQKNASTSEFIIKNNLNNSFSSKGEEMEEEIEKSVNDILEIISQNKKIPEVRRPSGNVYNEFWFANVSPFTPTAGFWQRWNLGNDFDSSKIVSNPPKYKSAEYNLALQKVKDAAKLRTSEQSAIINFWGGIPGTEQPAGIWQNRLWQETKISDDKKYAEIQMVLAQALSDSFMECWKVKFNFNTKRPSMADAEIDLAMPNPPFPSYTSGHSTISATAATVLCSLVSEKCELWKKDAVNAKNSRLWAGIHFDYDNEEGYKLGEEIGKYYLNFLK